MIPPRQRKNARLDFTDTILGILRGIHHELTRQALANHRADLEVCLACGCLCLPVEVCPSCTASRRTG